MYKRQKYKSNTEGRITNINSRTISIKAGSKTYRYDLADSVSVKYNGSSSSVGKLRDYFDDLTGSRYIEMCIRDRYLCSGNRSGRLGRKSFIITNSGRNKGKTFFG